MGQFPKKIHKAEREKLKRDHLNELFQELGQTLEPALQNNGKASLLGDASKLLRDLISQVESLRRENSALQKESQYVTLERDELKDENVGLQAEIEKLQMEIRERINAATSMTSLAQPINTLPSRGTPALESMYVVPVPHNQPTLTELSAPANNVPNPVSLVSRPHARYPTSTDSWTYQILTQQPDTGTEDDGCAAVPSSPKELLLLI